MSKTEEQYKQFELEHPNGLICKYCCKFKAMSQSGLTRHEKYYCENNPNRIKLKRNHINDKCNEIHKEGLPCKFKNNGCTTTWPTLNALRQHEVRCSHNPNRIKCNAWNNGLTKDTDERVKQGAETFHKNHELGLHKDLSGKNNPSKRPEVRKKISESLQKIDRSNTGGNSRSKSGWYNGIHLDSTFELAYYIYNKEHGINIIRNINAFPYEYNNKSHRYYPDFYLPNENMYIELKGYETEVDLIKYKSVENLRVLYEHDIKHMIKYVKDTYNVKDISKLYDEKDFKEKESKQPKPKKGYILITDGNVIKRWYLDDGEIPEGFKRGKIIKKISKSKQAYWITDGTINKLWKDTYGDIPETFRLGMSQNHKNRRKSIWITNGETNIKWHDTKGEIPEGFYKGRIMN